MAKRKSPTTEDQSTSQTPEKAPAAAGNATGPAPEAAPAAADESQSRSAVPAPGRGRCAWTIDNRVGYRKEDSPDGRKRQIRFADRPDGQRPDDELLGPVRQEKPAVSYAAKEKAWQARKTPDGLEALDTADQKLAEIGRKRTEERER